MPADLHHCDIIRTDNSTGFDLPYHTHDCHLAVRNAVDDRSNSEADQQRRDNADDADDRAVADPVRAGTFVFFLFHGLFPFCQQKKAP